MSSPASASFTSVGPRAFRVASLFAAVTMAAPHEAGNWKHGVTCTLPASSFEFSPSPPSVGQLPQRLLQLLGVCRLAVVVRVVLHEADALALRRLANYHRRLSHVISRLLQRADQGLEVVAVGQAPGLPAERLVLLLQRVQRHDIRRVAVRHNPAAADVSVLAAVGVAARVTVVVGETV